MSDTLEITLLDKQYRVACSADEKATLLAAVALLEGRLGKFGKIAKGGGERAAVMAALDLAHELVIHQSEAQSAQSPSDDALESDPILSRIGAIEARIAAALDQSQKLF
jgi:cell division protein ZapA